MSQPVLERLLREQAKKAAEKLLGELEQFPIPQTASPVNVVRSNNHFQVTILVEMVGTTLPLRQPVPERTLATSELELSPSHEKILAHAPIGAENRVKRSSLVLRAGYPRVNSYNRQLVKQLIDAGRLQVHPEDGKVFVPAC